MKFNPIAPNKPVLEELLSEDENFKLIVDNTASRYGRYVISTLRIDLLPGFGCGESLVAAMEKAKNSLAQQIAVMQERIEQLDKMIAEENSKEKTNEVD